MSQLHVYYSEEMETWVVAESAENAFSLLSAGGFCDGFDDVGADDFKQLSDDAELTIADEDTGDRASKTNLGWCESNGPGYLCSTNY